MSDSSVVVPDGVVEPVEPGDTTETLKKGAVGARHITALVIAATAPIAGVAGVVPIAIVLGNGVGTPGALFASALVLALFAVGFVQVVPHIRNAGAFYAYVSQGFGKAAGVASAYMILVAYLALGCSSLGGFGYYARDLLDRFFGVSVNWGICAVVAVAVSTLLAWLGVALAARLLLVVLAVETVVILVVDIAILGDQGLGVFSLDAIKPSVVFSGPVGIAAVYAFSCFLGFEGTAIYAEEAKQPLRTIPRATYTIVAIVGIFYGLSAWAMVAGAGFDKAVARSAEDPGSFLFSLTDQYVGKAWSDVVSVLVVTSVLASALAFHNASARYFFALARDGVLPKVLPKGLAAVDRRRGTPVAGVLLVGVVLAVVAGAFAIAGQDPLLQLATAMIGLGTVALIALLAWASVAIAVFFIRIGDRRLTVTVVPLLAAALLAACGIAGFWNYNTLTGSKSEIIKNLPWIYVPIALAGLAVAYRMKTRDPNKYALIGSTRV